MSNGIIYFIQPSELVGTNRYKIGCSNSPKLDRPYNGYRKGTRYISINECVGPLILEQKIKDQFNKLFKLISGKEYFEGDEYLMKYTFMQILEKHAKTNNNVIKLNNSYDDSSDGVTNDIKTFINEYFEFTNKKENYLLLKDIKMLYQQTIKYDQSLIKKFKENIERYMKATIIEKTKVKRYGKRVDVRSVIFGWKYKDDLQ